MSALGHKRTSRDIAIYVRFWGKSGLSGAPLRMSAYSHKRSFAMPLDGSRPLHRNRTGRRVSQAGSQATFSRVTQSKLRCIWSVLFSTLKAHRFYGKMIDSLYSEAGSHHLWLKFAGMASVNCTRTPLLVHLAFEMTLNGKFRYSGRTRSHDEKDRCAFI